MKKGEQKGRGKKNIDQGETFAHETELHLN